MSGPQGDENGTDSAAPRSAQLRTAAQRVARPERPELSDQRPPPVGGKEAMPRALRRAQSMWYLSVTMLLFTIVTMFLTRANLVSHLSELLHVEDATVSMTTLADKAPLVIYLTIGALLLVAVFEWGFATVLTRRRQWPRFVMVPLALVHIVVAALCALLIPREVWQGWLLDAVLVLGIVIALAATVRAFAPSVSRWIRSRKDEQEDDEATDQAATS